MAEYLTDNPTYRDPLFFGSSDASYADEPETRRSSQGYAFKFGGLMIEWKSTIQRTVTKSTTESELLSLSLAASQMEEWMRFFTGINPTLDCCQMKMLNVARLSCVFSFSTLYSASCTVEVSRLIRSVLGCTIVTRNTKSSHVPSDSMTAVQ
jgi:hypothetical protein